MKDFEKIYSKIKERVEFVQTDTRNSDKEINSYARKKLLKVILNIILIFLVLIFITKNLEFLFLLPFVFPPLFIYYLFVKGDRRETAHNPNINILTNQIFSSIIDDGFDGLTYCVNENGMDKEVYYKGHFRKCDEYFSKAELKGIINNINKFEMSYVGTLDKYLKREVDFTFRGYVLLIDLNKDTNMQIRIDNKKIKLLDEQTLSEKNEYLANNIKDKLQEFVQNNNMGADCTLVADKMYIRILTNDLTDRWSKRMSYKDVLKQYYDGITGIINLTDEILKLI